MGILDRIDRFMNPGDYVYAEEQKREAANGGTAKSAVVDSTRQWRELAEFLGLDGDSDMNAIQEATYYACMKILREAVARMPLRLMERNGDGVEEAFGHSLYGTLMRRPNRFCSPTVFWASVEQSRNHYGNAYVMRTGYGTRADPVQLWQMPSDEVEVWYDDALFISDVPDIYYIWRRGGKTRVLKSSEVLHFRSTDTFDGIMGVPVMDRLAETIKGGAKSQGFQNRLIASGMSGKAVLQYTGQLSDPSAKVFSDEIEKYISGEYSHDGKRAIIPIPVGSQITPLNIKLSDAQFEELKKYNAIQIANAFGIKPSQIGDRSKASYASANAESESFYVDTLLCIIKQYEEEISAKLLTRSEQKRYFVSFDTSTTLQASFETLVGTLAKAVDSSLMAPNEARARISMPALDGGDRLYANGAIIPLTLAGQQYTAASDGSEGGE